MAGQPDFKPAPRVEDQLAMKRARLREPWCVLCGTYGTTAHHIILKGQGGDDVEGNLVGLCGTGTTGCHGLLTAEHRDTRAKLGDYIREHRADTMLYLIQKLGGVSEARAWMKRRLLV